MRSDYLRGAHQPLTCLKTSRYQQSDWRFASSHRRSLSAKLAWRDGFLAFSGQSLADLVGQINRYSRVRLEIADPGVSTVTIGGRFRVGDLDGVLGVLRDNFGVKASRVDEHTIRLQRAAALP